MPYQPIENYGIVGDLHTVAIVGVDASIDFLSFPHFDSPTVFGALLDDERGGRFSLQPLVQEAKPKQLYLPDSNVLLTRFLSERGVAEISDFMPVEEAGHVHSLVRHAKSVRGDMRYRMICAPRFDYARAGHRAELRDGEVLFRSEGAGGLALRLRSTVPLRLENGDAVAEFTLPAGESASFVLEEAVAGEEPSDDLRAHVAGEFKRTLNFWREWIGLSAYQGRWRETVNRSALTLKLLVSRPHGSLVAAATFGLPEAMGGTRNWDYRYTWIRDASFTLYALIRLGYTEEAAAFMRWIEDRCHELEPDQPLQVLYAVDGQHRLPEETLPHSRAIAGPFRCGLATPPRASSSWTSTASCWTRSTSSTSTASRSPTTSGSS